MLKIIKAAFLFLLFLVMPVYASSLEDMPVKMVENFEITGGLMKDFEVTFDEKRNIVGTAPKNTVITIEIYKLNAPDENEFSEDARSVREILRSYEISVGSAGVFTQIIELSLNENIIEIRAVNGDAESVKTAIVKRKPIEIKLELEKAFILPVYNIPSKGDLVEESF